MRVFLQNLSRHPVQVDCAATVMFEMSCQGLHQNIVKNAGSREGSISHGASLPCKNLKRNVKPNPDGLRKQSIVMFLGTEKVAPEHSESQHDPCPFRQLGVGFSARWGEDRIRMDSLLQWCVKICDHLFLSVSGLNLYTDPLFCPGTLDSFDVCAVFVQHLFH